MALAQDYRLLGAILAPLLGAGLVMATGRRPNVREGCSLAAALALFAFVAWMTANVLGGARLHLVLCELLPGAGKLHGLRLALRADAMSLVFALSASFLWVLTVFYSAGYMRGLQEHKQTRFNTCFALALFGAMGCAFADNLLTLYLFYEIVSICTYPLVAHHQDEESYESGKKYLTYLTGAAKALVLPAMVLIYVVTGTLDFAANTRGGIFPPDTGRWLVTVLYACCLLGFAKNAVMPFHNWLPSAMVAPTPVSALLHAVAVVKVGVFSTVRVMLCTFGTDLMGACHLGLPTAYFVSFTIVVASIIALSKDNLKARLAYSTVSQLSYVILGVALLSDNGVKGGMVHIANHAFSKITLFFCAGAIYVATHKKNISELGGLGRAMPWTFGAFALASLSMIGAPPVAGFVTKWYLLNGAWDAHAAGIIAVLLASTLLNAAYFAPVIYQGFFGRASQADLGHKFSEAPAVIVVPLVVTALISVAIGLYPGFFMSLVQRLFSS